MFTIGEYLRARSAEEVWAAFRQATYPVRLIAGGTDLLPRLEIESEHRISAVDISDVVEWAGIRPAADGLVIGAATRMADVERSPLLAGPWRAIACAAGRVGSPQIRHLATLGGNLCNASPAAETGAPLLALEAAAEVWSPQGRRRLPLAEFFLGPGRTALAPGEVLAAVHLPRPPAGAAAVYLKHSPRRAMDLAVVGVAVLLAWAGGRLEARIALGAVAPTPVRARRAEAWLGHASRLDEATVAEAARLASEEARPISDVRASAEYRTAMVRALTARALGQLAAEGVTQNGRDRDG